MKRAIWRVKYFIRRETGPVSREKAPDPRVIGVIWRESGNLLLA
ncbi:hypothetical protein [Bacillus marinisedimentorum]|nr:hypothetical protein [Bacillus marinisedimentorum]